jgi:hypothetical protein
MTERPCAWCGMPMEIVRIWPQVERTLGPAGVVKVETEMATARCLVGHWFGGKLADLRGEHSGNASRSG